MATSDFSQIVELQEFRRLYEEQEEKVKIRLDQKDEKITELNGRVAERDESLKNLQQQIQVLKEDQEKMRQDYDRLRLESKDKIERLMERIKILNQQRSGESDPSAGKRSGIFR